MRNSQSPSELGRRIATTIRVALAERNISRAELARRTGMDDSYLHRRMTGRPVFDADDLANIAAALDVPISSLLGDGTGPTSPTPTHPTPSGPSQPPAPSREVAA